jgi:hypothetical protein
MSVREESLPGTVLAYAIAITSGLAIAWMDKRTDEVIVSIVPLLLLGAALGLARPAHAWRWGLLLGIWIPLSYWTGWFGAPKAGPHSPFEPLLALIPPTIAAYFGAVIERSGFSGTRANETA